MGFPAYPLLGLVLLAAPGDKPFKTPEALETWMTGYHARPEPARLRSALREATTLGLLAQPRVLGFLVEAHRASPEAKAALLATLGQEDLIGRLGILLVLRAMGEDVTDQLILLPDDYRLKMAAFPVMPDARMPLLLRPEPTPEDVQRALGRLDQAVGAYRATANPAVLEVLLEGLAEAADHAAFQAWVASGKQDPKPGPAVSRGCIYAQARQTVVQLRDQDPAAARAFRGLAVNPTMPEVARRELVALKLGPAPKP